MPRPSQFRVRHVIACSVPACSVGDAHLAGHHVIVAAMQHPDRNPGWYQSGGVGHRVPVRAAVRSGTKQLGRCAIPQSLLVAGDKIANGGQGHHAIAS